MSILTGPEIRRQMELGHILIDPPPVNVGPNSVDLCLGKVLKVVNDHIFDLTKAPEDVTTFDIPPEGFVLLPWTGYLGCTVEAAGSDLFVPWIDGRSTAGRFFCQVHQTAGRGDLGWKRRWTLELLATYRPVRVYAGLAVAQLTFFTAVGDVVTYGGRYADGDDGMPVLPKPLVKP